MKPNTCDQEKSLSFKKPTFAQNIFMASCNFALEVIYFVMYPPPPRVLHLKRDNGNLWQMELF